MKLLLTLGHNSSAILVDNEKVLCGYEEERLSGVKSDSSFPSLSIKQILEFYPKAKIEVSEVCVSHWFWSWDLVENKYYQPKFIAVNFPKATVKSVNYYETHHDLHAKSLWNFLDGDKSGLTIVADGFGNFGECLSFYIDGQLDYRSYEVSRSLGIMYQYAIRYLGMKENQDEYKLLGYEQNVSEEFKEHITDEINLVSDMTYHTLRTKTSMKEDMLAELDVAWNYWRSILFEVDEGMQDRAKIAYFVQQVLEKVMMSFIKSYNIKNIKVTGGVFYNVKLNNMILRYADKFEAHPLAGDQGCALGFTNVKYDDLFWGIRFVSEGIDVDQVIDEIHQQGYSELFHGNMEFGPRALCNTTCLALPRLDLVEEINAINGRDNVMPMAPVVTEEFANKWFNDIDKVGKSKNFMIIAYDYKGMNENIKGAAHIDKDRGIYTGRLQLATDPRIIEILNHFGGILINTSLNAHTQPIIYDQRDFEMMRFIQNRVKENANKKV